MLFRLLGPVEVSDERTGLCVHPRSAAQRSLLAALLARTGVPVDSHSLMVELWGDAVPDKAPNALQAHISRLRRTLMALEPDRGAPRLVKHGSGYVLWTDRAQVDIQQFALSMAAARQLMPDDPVAAQAALLRALGLWRGSALDGCGPGPIANALATRLEQARVEAIRQLASTRQRRADSTHHLDRSAAPAASHVTTLPARSDVGSALHELVDKLDGIAAEQRALRDTLHRLCALVSPQQPLIQVISAECT